MLKLPPKREAPASGQSATNRVKISDGERIKGVFRGEVREYWVHWPPQGRSFPCVRGTAQCDGCAQSVPSRKRIEVNFVTSNGSGGYVAKVIEQGSTFLELLRERQDDDGWNLAETIVWIERKGSGKSDTKYKIKKSDDLWTPAIASKIAAVPLQPLTGEVVQPRETAEVSGDDFDDMPF